MTLFGTVRSRLRLPRHDAAERFHRALLVPDALCSDTETARLLHVAQLLAPGRAMSEAGREVGLQRLLAAAAADGHGDANAGSHDELDASAQEGLLVHVVDTGGLGMLSLADVEPITPERAEAAAQEIAVLLAARRS